MHDSRLVKPLGTVLDGKFRLDRLLGAGGMGAVYLATHVSLGQRVAVKVLGTEERHSSESLARFVQEAQAASRIASEHVVRVFDLGHTEDGEPFIVMELLEGEDLAQILGREGRLALPLALHLVLQCCLGVAAAHAAGLVHRDLKPANLFAARRSAGGVLMKVLDFGLSKIVTDPTSPGLTQSSATFGTPLYMAPEQIMSAKHVDARCDQHALAMILFELLTGDPPYLGETPGAITVKIVTAPPPSARALRADVPPGLDAAIQRALAKQPEQRFADLGEFAEAIAPWAEPADQPMATAIRLALARGGPSRAAGAPGDDPSTLPLGRRPDTDAGVSTSVRAPRSIGSLGLIGGAALASLAIAGTAVWLTAREPTAAPAVATETASPSAPAAGGERPALTAAPSMETTTAPAVDAAPAPAPASSASASPSASASVSASAPRAPGPRRASPPRARSPKDPTEVFGQR